MYWHLKNIGLLQKSVIEQTQKSWLQIHALELMLIRCQMGKSILNY